MMKCLPLILCFSFFAAQAQKAPRMLRGPYLQAATPTSIVICWRTKEETQSVAWIAREDSAFSDPVVDTIFTREHRLLIEGLQPGTTYRYAPGDAEGRHEKDRYHFTTLPARSDTGSFSVAALGDCGRKVRNQRRVRSVVAREAGRHSMNAWILLGDNAYENGYDRQYQKKFFSAYDKTLLPSYPLFPAPGNHEYANRGEASIAGDSLYAYFRSFHLPQKGQSGGIPSQHPSYYSFDIGAAHFISLDSYGRDASGARLADTNSLQVQWLKRDLEAAGSRPWIIAFFHHPPYTMTSHSSDRSVELVQLRQQLVPILERYGVDLVLCGHSHSYERSKMIAGHYANANEFDAGVHVVKDGTTMRKQRHGRGTVYVVAGTAGQRLGEKQAAYPHPAMQLSRTGKGGALWIDGNGKELRVRWLNPGGRAGDSFTLVQ